ncbi:MAG: hypothetical protein JWP87_2249 [Labilithrix sp.]|nr:hypothetical protein [Labilithrix sp.]
MRRRSGGDEARVRARATIAFLVIAGAGAGACEGKKEAASAAEAGASAEAGTTAPRPTTTTTTTTTADAGPACKIMASEGGPVATADATAWLDVAAKASFTVRTLESGRELRFEGPGRVRACGDDVALVADGSAVGLPGSGEAPGAEQWVATACGVARWASGVHRFAGGRDACKLQSSLGATHIYVPDDVTADEVAVDGGAPLPAPAPAAPSDAGTTPTWRRIDAKTAFRLQGRGALDTPAAVKNALVACERAAQAVAAAALKMSSHDAGGGSLGELAAESVASRGLARAACAVAAVRVALAGSKPADQTRLEAANSRWRSGARDR